MTVSPHAPPKRLNHQVTKSTKKKNQVARGGPPVVAVPRDIEWYSTQAARAQRSSIQWSGISGQSGVPTKARGRTGGADATAEPHPALSPGALRETNRHYPCFRFSLPGEDEDCFVPPARLVDRRDVFPRTPVTGVDRGDGWEWRVVGILRFRGLIAKREAVFVGLKTVATIRRNVLCRVRMNPVFKIRGANVGRDPFPDRQEKPC